jgi:hypothetical protein
MCRKPERHRSGGSAAYSIQVSEGEGTSAIPANADDFRCDRQSAAGCELNTVAHREMAGQTIELGREPEDGRDPANAEELGCFSDPLRRGSEPFCNLQLLYHAASPPPLRAVYGRKRQTDG